MATNRGVACIERGEVQVQSIDFRKLGDASSSKKIEHGVILKIISTNSCGSDQHIVRGRTALPSRWGGGGLSAARRRRLVQFEVARLR
jgi:glutathione-independent formaldehyde dehydrogenase